MISPAPPCKHRPLVRGRGAKPELLGAKEDDVPRPECPRPVATVERLPGPLRLGGWGLLNCWPLKNPGKGRQRNAQGPSPWSFHSR